MPPWDIAPPYLHVGLSIRDLFQALPIKEAEKELLCIKQVLYVRNTTWKSLSWYLMPEN
jgi:hypothetical protein